jgi:hypothetical protein
LLRCLYLCQGHEKKGEFLNDGSGIEIIEVSNPVAIAKLSMDNPLFESCTIEEIMG